VRQCGRNHYFGYHYFFSASIINRESSDTSGREVPVMKRGENVKRGSPHSERAGEAVLSTGGRAALYRALRELSCSRCGGTIREDELFTREAEPASGLPLVRLCCGCAPFSRGGGLLDALLATDDSEESPPAPARGDVREKALSRLGPALEASRRRRGRPDEG
jgi:hypothetical protein